MADTPDIVEMLNRESGEVEKIPAAYVGQAYQTGKYGVDKSTRIPVVTPEGLKGSVEAWELPNLINQGFKVRDAADVDEEVKQKKYGENTIEAAATGAARGLTFGLSDFALQAAGVSQERLKEVKERNKAASVIGEVGGVALPLIMSAGTVAPAVAAGKAAASLGAKEIAAQAITKAGILPRLVGKVGASVESGVGKLLTKEVAEKSFAKAATEELVSTGATKVAAKTLGRRIAETVLSKGAGSAVEGAFYGGGQLVSEAALGDADFNGDALLAAMGTGMLYGGIVGGSVGAVTGTIGGIRTQKTLNKLARESDAIADQNASREARETLIDRTTTATPDAAIPEEDFAAHIKELRQEARGETIAKRSYVEKPIPPTQTEIAVSKLSGLQPDQVQYAKQRGVSNMRLSPSLDEKATVNLPKQLADEDLPLFNSMLEAQEKKVDGMLSKSKATFSSEDIWNRLEEVKNNFGSGVDAALEQPEAAVRRLNNYQRRLVKSGWVKAIKDEEGKIIDYEFRDISPKQFRKYIQGLRSDNKAWNKPLGTDLTDAEIANLNVSEHLSDMLKNAVGDKYKATMAIYADMVRTKVGLLKQFRTSGANWFANRFKNPLEQYIERGGVSFQPFEDEFAVGTKPNWIGNIKNLGKYVGRDYEQIVKDRTILSHLEPEAVMAGDRPGAVGTVMRAAGRLLSGNFSGAGQAVTEYAGGMLDTARQKLIVKAIDSNSEVMGSLVDRMARIEGVLRQQKDAIVTGISDALKEGATKTAPASHPEIYAKHADELAKAVSQPDMLAETLSHRMRGIMDVAPNIATRMMTQTALSIKYLHDKLPKDPTQGDQVGPARKWTPSDSETAKFVRIAEVVESPAAIFTHLKNNTLTPDMVAAVRQTHPAWYAQVVAEVSKQLADTKHSLPYAKKLQISVLLGQPVDSSIRSVGKFQQSFKQEAQKPHLKPVNLTIANRSESKAQSLGSN